MYLDTTQTIQKSADVHVIETPEIVNSNGGAILIEDISLGNLASFVATRSVIVSGKPKQIYGCGRSKELAIEDLEKKAANENLISEGIH